MNDQTSKGLGFTSVLLLIFITFKLMKVIAWSWFWVLAPLWIPVAIVILIIILIGVAAIIAALK